MGYGIGIDPKNFHEHYPFKNYGTHYAEYWSEDETIIYKAEELDKIDKIACIMTWLCAPLFILSIVLATIVGLWGLIPLSLFIINIVITGIVQTHQENKWTELLNRFYETADYKFQVAYNKAEQERIKQQKLYEETKDIVELYNILDNKRLSKENKINRLMKYIEKIKGNK